MNLGFLVHDLNANQLGYQLISSINKTSREHNITIYTESISMPCIKPSCPIMYVADAWCRHHPMVATSIRTAKKLLNFHCAEPRIFYVWDLEFLRTQHQHYSLHYDIYTNPNLLLIARSKSHSDIIKNNFNRTPDAIINDSNILGGILELGCFNK